MTLKLYGKILAQGFHPIYEFLVIAIFLIALSISGFMENSAGVVFLLIFGFLSFILRFAKVRLYYNITILAMLLLSNGLLSFVALQKMEIFTAYNLFRSRFQFTEVDLSGWKWKEDSRELSNLSIPIRLQVPDEMYFHNPKDLDLKESTGSGQIAGILSSSDHDPNSYPFVRIFFFPAYIPINESEIKEEVLKFIEFQGKQGEMEEVNEIQPNRDIRFYGRIPTNAFWTFFDIIRPRYAKTGFYFLPAPSGSKVLLHITENLEKGEYHEKKIQKILQSINLD